MKQSVSGDSRLFKVQGEHSACRLTFFGSFLSYTFAAVSILTGRGSNVVYELNGHHVVQGELSVVYFREELARPSVSRTVPWISVKAKSD